MSSLIQTLSGNSAVASRRSFMGRTGTLSAVAVAMLAGHDAMAAAHAGDSAKDVSILNAALGLEHEAINAYQLGAGSVLLKAAVLDVAVRFQADHKAHRDALIATIQKLGGTPVMEKKLEEYAKALKADTLRNQTDVLGRPAGKAAGYFYSEAMAAATHVWDRPKLKAWLTNLEDVAAYLASLSSLAAMPTR